MPGRALEAGQPARRVRHEAGDAVLAIAAGAQMRRQPLAGRRETPRVDHAANPGVGHRGGEAAGGRPISLLEPASRLPAAGAAHPP